MKRIIAIFLVLSLLIVSASAAGIYEVEEDTSVLMMFPVSVMSTDPGISTAEFDGDDSYYLRLIYENILNLTTHVTNRFDLELSDMDNTMLLIYQRLANTNTAIGTVNSWLSDIFDSVDNSNYWLQQIWGSISAFATENTLLDVLFELETINPTLSEISDKVATESTLSIVESSLYQGSGLRILDAYGVISTTTSDTPLAWINRLGFSGLSVNLTSGFSSVKNQLIQDANLRLLNADGVIQNTTSETSLAWINRMGFAGLRALLSGSESDNKYDGTITSNENVETSFTATGLGPMLNKYMDAIQHDTGLITYMFANPTDMEAKKDSESTTKSVTDNFLDSESDASIKLSDVGILKDSSKTVQQLGDTGVTPGQAFSQLTGNSDLFSFFSQETASDLDTTVMALNDDPDQQIVTTYYEDSRAAFYELIGKGGDE